jgi:hypothetical protein
MLKIFMQIATGLTGLRIIRNVHRTFWREVPWLGQAEVGSKTMVEVMSSVWRL